MRKHRHVTNKIMKHIVCDFKTCLTENGRINVNERSNDNKTISQSDVVDNDC
jgi:hypothetical protein